MQQAANNNNSARPWDTDQCILVDNNDTIIGSASKEQCHRRANIESGMLHRAFSVLLFNSSGKLLLQRRALSKHTFAGMLTNTCCSHPLFVDAEMESDEAIGVRRAARRRLDDELGIESLPLDALRFMTRIHYRAIADGEAFGEHEIDYVLIAQADVVVRPNPDEVMWHAYVDRNELRELMLEDKVVTPWFRYIAAEFLPRWWDALDRLESVSETSVIHRVPDMIG